jgi:glucan phosphorylase
MTAEPSQTLKHLAYNLRWAWHKPTADLLRSLAPEIWDATHNPIAVINAIEEAPDVLESHSELLAAAASDLDKYMCRTPQSVLG